MGLDADLWRRSTRTTTRSRGGRDRGPRAGTGRTGRRLGRLHTVEVRPDHRRQGLATRVIAELLDWGASRGATTAWLQVETHNAGGDRALRTARVPHPPHLPLPRRPSLRLGPQPEQPLGAGRDPRPRTLRTTSSSSTPAMTMPARLTPSWASGAADLPRSPRPSPSARLPAAGTVVTLMKTPTMVAVFCGGQGEHPGRAGDQRDDERPLVGVPDEAGVAAGAADHLGGDPAGHPREQRQHASPRRWRTGTTSTSSRRLRTDRPQRPSTMPGATRRRPR